MIVAGVDISLRRGQTVAPLDGDALTAEICTVLCTSVDAEVAAVVRLVVKRGASVVAVDCPDVVWWPGLRAVDIYRQPVMSSTTPLPEMLCWTLT